MSSKHLWTNHQISSTGQDQTKLKKQLLGNLKLFRTIIEGPKSLNNLFSKKLEKLQEIKLKKLQEIKLKKKNHRKLN